VTTGRRVTVVTDSTSDLPASVAAASGVRVVPLTINFGDQTFLDGVDITSARVRELLERSPGPVRTSPPPAATFEAVFREEMESGRDVVCVTISGILSETIQVAQAAAEAVAPARIAVIDSGTTSMGLGLIALEGAATARHWAGLRAVSSSITTARRHSSLFAAVPTLDSLVAGGRVGRAGRLAGSALALKPILTVRDGIVTPVERPRSWPKAIDRLAELARMRAPLAALAVVHTGDLTAAERLFTELAPLAEPDRVYLTEAGPALSIHTGPGAVGVALLHAKGTHEHSDTL
jgi:DegV family protein with EDD domain